MRRDDDMTSQDNDPVIDDTVTNSMITGTTKSGETMSSNERGVGGRRRGLRAATLMGVAGLCAAGAALVPVARPSAAATGTASEGVLCTAGSGVSGVSNFTVQAADGEISMPDGNAIYTWSYTARGSFQFPGPVLCVTEGDTVNVTLQNDLKVPTSIQFPGIDGVTVGTAPVSPQANANGDLTSLVQGADAGQSVTYAFTAAKPGTYLYKSGTDPQLQVQMGLFGTLIVYPAASTIADVAKVKGAIAPGVGASPVATTGWNSAVGNVRCAYDDPATHVCDESALFDRTHENLMMLSEVDPALHNFMQQNKGDVTKLVSKAYTDPYRPHYYLINGRSFPDTIAPNDAAWLPAQPYGGLAHVEPWDATINPLDALIRYVGVGVTSYPFHPHSNHERVFAEDGALLKSGTDDMTEEKFSIMVSPGATTDATFRWTNEEGYANTTGSRVPVAPPTALNLKEGDFWSGSPYLGDGGPLNAGINGKTQCGEYYHVAHSHDLSQATNYGASFGGMLTLIRVEPPDYLQTDGSVPKCNF